MGSLGDRLWSKVSRGGHDECWLWTAGKDRDGYGKFRVGSATRRAHAVVLEDVGGGLAQGRDCLHSCDNPPCCNPGHLRWGSKQDNRAECVAKRRQARGEAQGSAKLTQAQVEDIRSRHRRLSATHGTFALAREFGVNKNTIDRIVNNHGWRH